MCCWKYICNHGCYLGVCISEPKLCQKPVVSRVIGCPNLKRCFQFNFQTFHIPQSLTYRKVWPRILPKLYGYHTQVIRGLKGVYLCLWNCQDTERQQSSEILGWNYCQWKVCLWWWFWRVPHGKTRPLGQPLKGVHLVKIKHLVVKRKNHLPLSFLPPFHPVETPEI